MNHLIRNPVASLPPWNDDINSLFETFCNRCAGGEEASQGLVPRLDVVERDNEFVVKAEMPA